MQKVSEFIDIQAPCEEVFNVIAGIERRMQLSPLWGINQLLGVSPEYPKPGSSYRIRVLKDVPFGIAGAGEHAVHGALAGLAQVVMWKMGHETQKSTPAAEEPAQPKPPLVRSDQEYFVKEWEPPFRLSYALDEDCKTIITWKLQSIPRGTRLTYEEVFCPEVVEGKDFLPTVRHVVHEWLLNIKRYGELRGTRGRVFVKRLLDRFFLRLRPDQRRTVLLILFMQGIAMVTFVIAAVGLGIANWVIN